MGSYRLFWEKGKTHIAENKQKKKVFFFFQYIPDISMFRF